jgi:glycosyltransferase involved in cell wall biosynthesis
LVMGNLSHGPRVLHILAPAHEGGLEKVVTMLSAGQGTKRAHVAAVVALGGEADDHPFITRLEALGVPVTRVEVGGRGYLREYRSLVALVARLKPAVLHTHGYRADVIGGFVARARGIPTVSTVHGFTGGSTRNRLNERVQCLALRRADAVIAVSRPLVKRLAHAGIPLRKIHCVPNGFAPSSHSLTRVAARRELGISEHGLVAGWVGRLAHEKGPDVMLDALFECDPAWRLSIIGDGREHGKLRQRALELGIEARVSWHGAVANAGALLTAFDALVLTSRTEGTPIVLLEAMHACVPIVATRVGGVPDVVTPAHALLVPPEQPRTIARALEEVAREQSAASHRAMLARERVVQSFDSAAWLSEVDAVYREACA